MCIRDRFVFVHVPPIFSVLLTYSLKINSILFWATLYIIYVIVMSIILCKSQSCIAVFSSSTVSSVSSWTLNWQSPHQGHLAVTWVPQHCPCMSHVSIISTLTKCLDRMVRLVIDELLTCGALQFTHKPHRYRSLVKMASSITALNNSQLEKSSICASTLYCSRPVWCNHGPLDTPSTHTAMVQMD